MYNKKFKWLAFLVISALIMSVLSGCGGSAPKQSEAGKPAVSQPQAPAASPAKPASSPAPAQPAKVTQIAFGGSSTGGVFFYMVGVLANMVTAQDKTLNVTNVATGASEDNVQKLLQKELQFGMAHASHTYQGSHNLERYAKVKGGEDLRGVAFGYESNHYFVTLKKTGIKSLKDLVGKSVAMGQPGSGAAYNSDIIMDTLGYTVKKEYMQFADAGNALKEGRIAALGQSGAPSGAVSELAETTDIYIIPFTEEELKKVLDKVSFFYSGKMPKGTYKGVDEDVLMPHFAIFWLTHKDVPDDVVYRMLDVVFKPENFKKLGEEHVMWKQLKPGLKEFEALKGPAVHPGALKFYQDKGMK